MIVKVEIPIKEHPLPDFPETKSYMIVNVEISDEELLAINKHIMDLGGEADDE